VLLAVGIELRFAEFGQGLSDVPETIRITIDNALRGGNPYAPTFNPAIPFAQPFPYGPLGLIWYLPLHDPRLQEFAISIVLVAVLAVRGNPMGLALWATLPIVVHLASDGSNDHSAALFLLVAFVVLERMPRLGALLIGVAAGFKIYALAWLPPIFFWAGASAVAVGVAGFVAAWLPAVLLWGWGNILNTFQIADELHGTPYFSLGQALSQAHLAVSRGTLNTFRLICGVIAAVAVSTQARTHRGVFVAGTVIYLVTLYAGFWGTPAYLLPPVLVACWYLDLWLGPDGGRIAWPGDPVARLSRKVDRRWPPVDTTRIATP
jgi:hypothetical protein